MVLFKLSQLKDNVKYNLESLTVVWREEQEEVAECWGQIGS